MYTKKIAEITSGAKLETADTTFAFAASSAQYTTKLKEYDKPQEAKRYNEVVVLNPSIVTDLTVEVGNIEEDMDTDGLSDVKTVVKSIAVVKGTGAVIEDCEDAWSEITVANVTSSAEASVKLVGSNSAKIDIAAGAAAGLVASEAISSTGLSKYTHIAMWIRASANVAANAFQLLLDNTAECASPLETLNIPALTANTWHRVVLPLANPATDLAIISVGLKMVTDVGAVIIYIDDVTALKATVTSTVVEGFRNGSRGFVRISNDTALSAVQEFNAKVRIKELM